MSTKKNKLAIRKLREYKKESHVVRLSPELHRAIREIGHRNESYDNIIRRILGMPALKYAEETALILYAIDDGTHLFQDEAVARGESIRLAVKSGDKKFPVKKVRTAC